jgi:hypothetical protein
MDHLGVPLALQYASFAAGAQSVAALNDSYSFTLTPDLFSTPAIIPDDRRGGAQSVAHLNDSYIPAENKKRTCKLEQSMYN